MEFLYKTRGHSSPDGKSRVCILGHPDDYSLYFDTLSQQILAQHNCAVWYPSDEFLPSDEAFRFQLSQMQLVIVMVTGRFFLEHSALAGITGILTEELHIPMLPIVFETGLDAVYAQYYKTMHYISPVTNDTYATDISYEQKLSKFINSILVSDDDIAQINQAFDASLFISYRKKDREHAIKLMKQIHSCDLFLGVAIWYDELLVPGDSFLSGINEKLHACDLFTMVVTPNLLEPGNFVMEVEYKEACTLGKSIFPVEMVSTNPLALAQCYPQIPESICLNKGSHFEKKLYEKLFGRLVHPAEFSQSKFYYLGLAYLNGINVEVNFEIAQTLLHKAADMGYVPAFEQLITMYREGQGVSRDLQKSLELQGILINGLYHLYQSDTDTATRNKLHYHLFQMIESYEKGGLIEQAEKYLQMMHQLADIGHSEFLLSSQEDKTSLGIYTNYLMKYASLLRKKGHHEQARDCYEKCAATRLQLLQWSETPEEQWMRMRAVSTIYLELGDMEMHQLNNLDAAEYFYTYTNNLREMIVASCAKGDATELGYRRDLSNIIWRLGDLMLTKAQIQNSGSGKNAMASYEYFTKCLTMRLALLEEAKTEQAEDEVATAYLGLAKLILYCHPLLPVDLDYGLTCICEALTIAEKIMNLRKSRQSLTRVVRMSEIKASLLMNKKEPEAAFLALKHAQKLMEALVSEQHLADDIFRLAGLYKDAADLFLMIKQSDYAITYYQKALALLEMLVQAAPDSPYYRNAYTQAYQILQSLLAD